VRGSEAGRQYRLDGRLLPGFTETVVCAVEDGASTADVDALLSERDKDTSASDQARELLLATLREAGGQMESDQLDATVAEAAG
jgi:hypothetical protein